MRRWFPLIKFVADICISAALAAAVLVGEWRYVAAHGALFVWLIIVPPALLLCFVLLAAPFIALLAFGLVKGRYGFVLGTLLSVVTTYGLHSWAIEQENEALEQKKAVIAKLASTKADLMRADHTLLAVDDNNNGSSCDEICIKVLATSNYTFALRSNSRHGDHTWMLYAQAEGPACFAKENAKLTLQFLLRGFPDKCATRTPTTDLGDGLLLRVAWSRNPNLQLIPDMPEGFTGTVYESFERIGGHDRLLARHIEGGLQSTLDRFPLWKQPPAIDVGTPIDRMSFLAQAIGRDVGWLRQPAAPFPFDEVLTGIEKYFDQKETLDAETFRTARWAWLQVAANASRPQAQLLKDRILRLFDSNDPFRTELGIEAISFMKLDDRSFPDDVMLDLVFVPMSREATASLLEKQLERQFASGRPPPTDEVRERAKAHLNDPNLKPWQLRILTQISLLQ